MQTWKITLTYDGTLFHGWQIQPELATVQGTLAEAILRITGEKVLPQGSGRTDTGVHALGQVASFALQCPIPAANLQRALNHALPASIRALTVEAVASEFHARHGALRKTYEYRIFPGAVSNAGRDATERGGTVCSPMLAPYVWDCPLPLELKVLHEAASYVAGTHDFSSFAAADPDKAAREAGPDAPAHASPVRTIYRSCWQARDGLYIYRVTGNGFLHHMVRNLVGTFVEAGTGRIAAGDIPGILAARNRSAAGPTAPAQGLFLIEVEY
jgi:tRNA pseudouridine38-40 synthase